jgi:hypothetical protein
MKILNLIISIVAFSFSFAQNNLLPIKNWKRYPVPTNKDSLEKYSYDPNFWVVSVSKNKVYVSNWVKFSVKGILPFEIKPSNPEEHFFSLGI